MSISASLQLLINIAANVGSGDPSDLALPAPILPPNRGRIVVYRAGVTENARQPTIQVDGTTRGICEPAEPLVIDVEPGAHVLTATTDWNSDTFIQVDMEKTVYVRCTTDIDMLTGQPRLEVVTHGIGLHESGALSRVIR